MAARARRVLVADDHSVVRDVVREILTANGFEVVTVDNGSKAVALAKAEMFDVIMLDVNIPHDGLATLCELRQAGWPGRIVLMSSDPSHRADAFARGADAFVDKPFILRDLCDALDPGVVPPG